MKKFVFLILKLNQMTADHNHIDLYVEAEDGTRKITNSG